MLAREITHQEIELGIGTERSSTRLSPIYKTITLNIPYKKRKLYRPSIPIDPTEGTPILAMPLLFIPHDESVLFGTPSIIEKSRLMDNQPTSTVIDYGKGTGTPFVAALLEAKDEDILILAACDQFMSPAITKAVNQIINRMEKEGFSSGTVLTTGTRNPAFSYIKVDGKKAIEFMLKGTIPKEDMIAETMLVCCRAKFLRAQINKMKDAKLEELEKLYPYSEEELLEIQQTLHKMTQLLGECETSSEFLEQSHFCDFSKVIHRLLIPDMTFATVEYQKEWDDLGDWQKVYRSPIFPKDDQGNVIFSKKDCIHYGDCSNSVIANFSEKKIIVRNLNSRIFAVGE
ncbi:MAG: hypothetical protein GF308_10280, partial [Candidatus Heimdallarchaeota archaeon]|nr:hypothetical protein [Candidatus Heimdallarchaeota archaeon]